MRFYIICFLMKVIINLKIGHKDLFVAFNVILVLLNIFLKYYMFLWNTTCFCFLLLLLFCLASTKTMFLTIYYLFLVYHVAFSSFSQGKCFSSLKFRVFIWWMFFFFSWWQNISPRETLDQQCNHEELLFDKAIFIDNFWGSVAFEKLLNFFG